MSTVYQFSYDWFSNNIPVWTKLLTPLQGKKLNALEIGTYEGRSATWLLENVLTHKDSKLHCIDHFLDKAPKTKQDTYKTFLKNIIAFKDKVHVHRGLSRDMLTTPHMLKQQFDIIYIDASKHSQNVLEDIMLAYPLLKRGGLLIMDDNTFNREHDASCPAAAILAFRTIFANEIKIIHDGWQLIVQKRHNPGKKRRCYCALYSK